MSWDCIQQIPTDWDLVNTSDAMSVFIPRNIAWKMSSVSHFNCQWSCCGWSVYIKWVSTHHQAEFQFSCLSPEPFWWIAHKWVLLTAALSPLNLPNSMGKWADFLVAIMPDGVQLDCYTLSLLLFHFSSRLPHPINSKLQRGEYAQHLSNRSWGCDGWDFGLTGVR